VRFFVQNLVGAFVDVYHQSLARVRSLEEETASLRHHVNSLKRELSDAVHREFSEQVGGNTSSIPLIYIFLFGFESQ
jgi:hypothetical protein